MPIKYSAYGEARGGLFLTSWEVRVFIAQSYPTLCKLMDCSPPNSSVQGILRKECWSGLPFPSPGDLPNPGIEPGSPIWQADSLPTEP